MRTLTAASATPTQTSPLSVKQMSSQCAVRSACRWCVSYSHSHRHSRSMARRLYPYGHIYIIYIIYHISYIRWQPGS